MEYPLSTLTVISIVLPTSQKLSWAWIVQQKNVTTVTNLRVETVNHKKDNQSETILVEIVALAFFLGIVYMFTKGIL